MSCKEDRSDFSEDEYHFANLMITENALVMSADKIFAIIRRSQLQLIGYREIGIPMLEDIMHCQDSRITPAYDSNYYEATKTIANILGFSLVTVLFKLDNPLILVFDGFACIIAPKILQEE